MKRIILPVALLSLLVSCERKVIESVTPAGGKDSAEAIEAASKEYVLAKEGMEHLVGNSVDMIKKQHMYDVQMEFISQGISNSGEMEIATSKREWRQCMGPDKFRDTILVDKKRQSVGFGGKMVPGEEADPSPLLNVPVLYERVDGAWVAKLEDESKLTDEISGMLGKMGESIGEDLKIYGAGPRRLGDEWEVDVKKVKLQDAKSGFVKLMFMGVEEFQGQECAVFSVHYKVDGQPDGENFTMSMEMKGTIKRSLKYYVDLESKLSGTVVLSGSPNKSLRVKGQGKVSIEETAKVVVPPAVQ
ncbi:hypothetical protein Rhal01_02772 [Rubritalea halochordaticola]|uniref:DUF4292 domain-containing protein n=1 Tax=Rubritalea halochordaticola TaxID=714537 RepID=A0ABP9V1Q3_9BACT